MILVKLQPKFFGKMSTLVDCGVLQEEKIKYL